jgi:hypothetical protein
MKIDDGVIKFLVANRSKFLDRKFMFYLFSVVANRPKITLTKVQLSELEKKSELTVGEHLLLGPSGIADASDGTRSYTVCYQHNELGGTTTTFTFLCPTGKRPLDFIDTFELTSDMIANFPKGKQPFQTTIGQYLTNCTLLETPFGGAIPYVQGHKDLMKCEGVIAEGLLTKAFVVDQYMTFVNNLYILQSYAELCVSTGSLRGMTTHPDVTRRKAELLKQYAGRLNDPLVAKLIEDELLKLDTQYIEGDTATRFIDALGSKGREIWRKKLYLAVGGIESFDDVSGNYEFIKNSLSEGWDPKDFPMLVNEIRKGSYSRGKETELGGMQTKFVMRIFSDLRVTDPDCGTTEGVRIFLAADIAKKFLNRFIVVRGKAVELTEQTIKEYIDKDVVLRSPMTCRTDPGLCYVCTGRTFENISVKGISMWIVDVTSTFTLLAMKNMHGTKISSRDLAPDFERFLI